MKITKTSVASTYKRNITSFSPSKAFVCFSCPKRKPIDHLSLSFSLELPLSSYSRILLLLV